MATSWPTWRRALASRCCRAFHVAAHLKAGRLVHVLPRWSPPELWLTLYYPPYQTLPPRIAAFEIFRAARACLYVGAAIGEAYAITALIDGSVCRVRAIRIAPACCNCHVNGERRFRALHVASPFRASTKSYSTSQNGPANS